jgi:hypothetical protein
MRTLACFLAYQTRILLLKMALIGAAMIVLAEVGMAATITVHAPDSEGRVFIDVVGKIDDGDFETFKQKTDQIHLKKLVIVTLISNGGAIGPAIQIGELVRKRRMLTFVPSDRTCASACALIWVAGWLRTVGDTPQIGFHAAYDEDTRRESGAGNAVMGAYLRGLEFDYKAIHFMTHKGPTSVEWLTPELAKEMGVAWFMLQPPRAIPIPAQQPGLHPPPQVIAAWSKLRPVTASPERGDDTASPERGNQTVVFKRASPIHVPHPPEEARDDRAQGPPEKTQERIEPGSQQAPVAQKVVLYEEDPAPNGKRFVGSAIWRTETITARLGQPPELVIRADIEVPERKLAMTWMLRPNTDKGLPATHTVEIMFKLPPDFPGRGVSNIPGILMKQGETTRGVPLAGLSIKVTPGFYLIGLSNQEADKDRNLQLVKERGWFDIPVVYGNNRRAIVAIEKGTSGDRAFADAFKAWEPSNPLSKVE